MKLRGRYLVSIAFATLAGIMIRQAILTAWQKDGLDHGSTMVVAFVFLCIAVLAAME